MLDLIILSIVVILVLVMVFKQPRKEYHSNWSQLLPNFKFSTKEFYKLLKKEMFSHDVDKLFYKEVDITIGGVLSSKRTYLRIKWQDYYYDICFAPFGDGCFVSWWLIYQISSGEDFYTRFPFIGEWIRRSFYRKTYYKIDSASMFMTYAQHSVLAVCLFQPKSIPVVQSKSIPF